ncbi:nitroreductase/quinone reductase family protein [Jiangella gansuensis]|uniref:nitroreductase/quinone reductase family protein n=1 Tax=Jiangella gansuensis TaxID=281473 RepID=UPI00047EC794|nr:nitroreductase/quinone reductase family protein [Jiangella gansuensis]
MGTTGQRPPRVPPRWFVRSFWAGHRSLYRATGGRIGLSRPKPGKYGLLRLRTIGRRSGMERAVILAYFEDGADLVLLAMNGWGDPPPAWWLNLLANPDTTVDLVDGARAVHAREAQGAERERLWAAWRGYSKNPDDLDALAGLRSRETPVVVLEPAATVTG